MNALGIRTVFSIAKRFKTTTRNRNARLVIHGSNNVFQSPVTVDHKYGWTPKLDSKLPDLSFAITRTAGGSLPIYTDYKGGGTKVVTVVRKISGNVEDFIKYLEEVTFGGEKVPIKILPGKIVIDGNFHYYLKVKLAEAGF